MAHEALRRLAERRVVVHHERQRLGLDAGGHEPAIGQRRHLARQQRAPHLEVLGQDGVHGLLFGGDEPALVLVGALAHALVEELEHLAQTAGLEPAHLHVLHEHGQLVVVEHARAAAHGVLHPRVAHDGQAQLAHRHHVGGVQQRVVGQQRSVAPGRHAVGAHDAHGRSGRGDAASARQQRRRDVVGRVVLQARAHADSPAVGLRFQFFKKIVRRVFNGRGSISTHIRSPSTFFG